MRSVFAPTLFVLAALTILPSFGRSQPLRLEEISAGLPPKATVLKMTLHPAAIASPALKYTLLPEVRDLRPGNAALLYQRAQSHEWWSNFLRADGNEKNSNLLEMPFRKMPSEKVLLIRGALEEMDLAARREYCDWEMGPRLREEGPGLLIPDVQGFRNFAVMLALRSRIEMIGGRLDKAVYSFQTGLTLSRHVNESPILISSLVALAIGNLTLSQVEEFVQLENAPNLYWALADLPRPFIDLRKSLQGEKVMVEGIFPQIRTALQNPGQAPLHPQTIKKYLAHLVYLGENNPVNAFEFALTAARNYPQARAFLVKEGFTTQQIEALPVTQVALMYSLAVYDQHFDEMYKWQSLPFWQARAGMKKAREKFDQARKEQPDAMYIASYLLPRMDNVYFSKSRTDRRIALLQTVEALRLHAAQTGELPATLEDIRSVPLPLDPITGKTFEYTRAEGTATLHAPPPAGEASSERNAVRYEITLQLPKKK